MVSSPFTAGSSVTAECFRRKSSIFSLSSGSRRAPADHIRAKTNKRAICSSLSCFSSRPGSKPCKVDAIHNYCPPRTNHRIRERKIDAIATCRRSIACLMYIHSKIDIFGVTAEKTKSITSWEEKNIV